jgi:hypothetical protein
MPGKLTLILVTATACGALPQIAHASCSGSACSAFSFANNKFTNKDKDLKIHLTGCFIKSGSTCGSPPVNFDITVDSNSSKPLTVPASVGLDVKVDVKTAAFVGALEHAHVQTVPGGSPATTTTNNQTGGRVKGQGCDLSFDKVSCEIEKSIKEKEDIRKKRDQARTDLAKAYDEHDACVKAASLNPIKITVVDSCLASQQKIDALRAEISKDYKLLGETEPGAPVPRGTVVPTKPIPPGKPEKSVPDKVKEKIGLPCPPGKPGDPKDIEGNNKGVFDGKTVGLDCK